MSIDKLVGIAMVSIMVGGTFIAMSESNAKVADCRSEVKRHAKHVPDFTNDDPSVDGDRVSGTVSLQNGFGAWTPYEYECIGKRLYTLDEV